METRQKNSFAPRRGRQSGCGFGSLWRKKKDRGQAEADTPRSTAYLCRASFVFAQDAIERVVPAFEASIASLGGGRDRFTGSGIDDVSDRVAVAVEEGGSDCVQEVWDVREGEDALVGDAEDEVEVVGEEPEDRVGVLVPSRDLGGVAAAEGGGGGALLDQGFSDEGIKGRWSWSERALPEDEAALGPEGRVGSARGPQRSDIQAHAQDCKMIEHGPDQVSELLQSARTSRPSSASSASSLSSIEQFAIASA